MGVNGGSSSSSLEPVLQQMVCFSATAGEEHGDVEGRLQTQRATSQLSATVRPSHHDPTRATASVCDSLTKDWL